MHKLVALHTMVENLRKDGLLSNEQANLIVDVTKLDPDDQVLANRALSRGADPFAIQYLATGEVSEHIRQAHIQGPGLLEGEERDDWLFLASLSVDESKKSSLRERLHLLVIASDDYSRHEGRTDRQKHILLMEDKILHDLPFTVLKVGGKNMRLYTSDLGFASAYWNGEDFAAVLADDGNTFVGTKPNTSLGLAGITVDKKLSDQFGIIFPKD